MALTKCSECGQPVSTRARFCPHCGAPPPGLTRRIAVFAGVAAAVTGAVVAVTTQSAKGGEAADGPIWVAVALMVTLLAALIAVFLRRRG